MNELFVFVTKDEEKLLGFNAKEDNAWCPLVCGDRATAKKLCNVAKHMGDAGGFEWKILHFTKAGEIAEEALNA